MHGRASLRVQSPPDRAGKFKEVQKAITKNQTI